MPKKMQSIETVYWAKRQKSYLPVKKAGRAQKNPEMMHHNNNFQGITYRDGNTHFKKHFNLCKK